MLLDLVPLDGFSLDTATTFRLASGGEVVASERDLSAGCEALRTRRYSVNSSARHSQSLGGDAPSLPLDIEETLRFANAVGAIATTTNGVIPALPTLEQVDVLLTSAPASAAAAVAGEGQPPS